MKVRTRFIRSVIDAAKAEETAMPWTRGAHRRGIIAARGTTVPVGKVRTA